MYIFIFCFFISCKTWVKFLWWEDFKEDSKTRKYLKNFISLVLQEIIHDQQKYKALWKATQTLIKAYRDQNLLQLQIEQLLFTKYDNVNLDMQPGLLTHAAIAAEISDDRNIHKNVNSGGFLSNVERIEFYSDEEFEEIIAERKQNASGISRDLQWFLNENESAKSFLTFLTKKRNSNLILRLNMEQKRILGRSTSSHVKNDSKCIWPFPSTVCSTSKKPLLSSSKSTGLLAYHRTPKISELMDEYCVRIAQQFTLLAFEKLKAIRPTELLRKAWTKKDKHLTAPNVAELIFFMESISIWAKLEIVSAEHKFRRETFSKICRIGILFHSYGNQYGAIQIYLTLQSTDVRCFSQSREVLNENSEFKEFLSDMKMLINSSQNNKSLRENLWTLQPPAIPYLGVLLKDAFIIDEQMEISKLYKVNVQHMKRLYDVYDKIEMFRQMSYAFVKNEVVVEDICRELYRAKKIDVVILSAFCREQGVREKQRNNRNDKRRNAIAKKKKKFE